MTTIFTSNPYTTWPSVHHVQQTPEESPLQKYEKFRSEHIKKEGLGCPDQEMAKQLRWHYHRRLERSIIASKIRKLAEKDLRKDSKLEYAVAVLEDRSYWEENGVAAETIKQIFDRIMNRFNVKTDGILFHRIQRIAKLQLLKNQENLMSFKLGEGITLSVTKELLLKQIPKDSPLYRFLMPTKKLSNAPLTTLDLSWLPEKIAVSPNALLAFFDYLCSRKEIPHQLFPQTYRIANFFCLEEVCELIAAKAIITLDRNLKNEAINVHLFAEMLSERSFSKGERVFVDHLFSRNDSHNTLIISETIDSLCESETVPEWKKPILKAMKYIRIGNLLINISITIPSNFSDHPGLCELFKCFPEDEKLFLEIAPPKGKGEVKWMGLLPRLIQEGKKRREIYLDLLKEEMNAEEWKALCTSLKDPKCQIKIIHFNELDSVRIDLCTLSQLDAALESNTSVETILGNLKVIGEGKDSEKAKELLRKIFNRPKPQTSRRGLLPRGEIEHYQELFRSEGVFRLSDSGLLY